VYKKLQTASFFHHFLLIILHLLDDSFKEKELMIMQFL